MARARDRRYRVLWTLVERGTRDLAPSVWKRWLVARHRHADMLRLERLPGAADAHTRHRGVGSATEAARDSRRRQAAPWHCSGACGLPGLG